jgi:hypothetical protein
MDEWKHAVDLEDFKPFTDILAPVQQSAYTLEGRNENKPNYFDSRKLLLLALAF